MSRGPGGRMAVLASVAASALSHHRLMHEETIG
jgi:hypothetical protein